MQGHQGPGRMVEARGEQLAADPAAQRPQGDAILTIQGDQLRPELVAPTAAGQGGRQGRVLAQADGEHVTPAAWLDQLAPHRQGAAPGNPQQGHQHQGAAIPDRAHHSSWAALGWGIPAVARHRPHTSLTTARGEGLEPARRHHRIGIHQRHQLRGPVQRPEGLAQRRTFERSRLRHAGQGNQPGALPAGQAPGLQPGDLLGRQGPGRILQRIHHHQQTPGARVGLGGQGRQRLSQAWIGAPQAQHHLSGRGGPSQLGTAGQAAAHHQGERQGEQQLQHPSEQQRRGQPQAEDCGEAQIEAIPVIRLRA